MLKVGIAGATGYTGIDLIRLLQNHSNVSIETLFSKQHAGKSLLSVYPHLSLDKQLESFDENNLPNNLDVLFLALPHSTSHAFLPKLLEKVKWVIDLSADFRLKKAQVFEKYYGHTHGNPSLLSQIPYGLTEWNREQISQSKVVANPGCYPTCSLLALLPLAKEGLIEGVPVIDAKSGVSGAGRGLKESSLFCEVNDHLSAYGTIHHRHTPEIEENFGSSVLFSPHLIPMNRGMLASIYVDINKTLSHKDMMDIFQKYYSNEPFVRVFSEPTTNTRFVTSTNECWISFIKDEKTGKWVIFSMIDNLIKGASGQAIQNMNCMCGFKEIEGLQLQASFI